MKITFATNDARARFAFLQRQEYKTHYPAGIRDYRKIDFWYDEMMFGRVDQKGDVVYPSEGFLKQLESEKGSYFVLNFVADAYASFRSDMLFQETQNHFINLDGTPFMDRFEPTKSWISINKNYDIYIQDYYNSFLLPFMSEPSRVGDVIDFDDFVIAFTRLIDRLSLAVPLTKTEYITSKYSSPLVSGLVVEFAEKEHGDDPEKILGFVNNINFELYREMASRNGFAVDMNAPWRLIADVGSKVMARYLKNNDTTLEGVFGKYYYKSSFLDIPNLKVYMRTFYNSFVRAFPKVRTHEVTTRNGRSISLTKVERRVMMGRGEYDSKYTNLFWLRLYIYIRAKETNRDWDQYKFDHIVQRASDFFTYSGEQAALKFINKEVKRPLGEYLQVDEHRKGSFNFKRKRE
jgi:hypothetical protein